MSLTTDQPHATFTPSPEDRKKWEREGFWSDIRGAIGRGLATSADGLFTPAAITAVVTTLSGAAVGHAGGPVLLTVAAGAATTATAAFAVAVGGNLIEESANYVQKNARPVIKTLGVAAGLAVPLAVGAFAGVQFNDAVQADKLQEPQAATATAPAEYKASFDQEFQRLRDAGLEFSMPG